MTTNPNPWRERNLQRIAEARRILQAARAQELEHNTDSHEPPEEQPE